MTTSRIGIAAGAVAITLLSACSSSGGGASAPSSGGSSPSSGAGSSTATGTGGGASKSALIQLIDPIPSTYIEANLKGAHDQAAKLGLTNLQESNANGDAAKMVAQINDAITKGAKAIILNPVNSEAAGPAIKRANDAGVCTVIAYSNIENTPQTEVAPGSKGFVGWDENAGGTAIAKALADKIGGKGNVVIVGGLAANLGAQLRVKSAQAEWKDMYPNIKVLGVQNADFDPAKARTVTQNFIQSFGDKINGILYIDDGMGAAGAQVVQSSKLKNRVVIGSFGGARDFVKLIKQGQAFATIPFAPTSDYQAAVDLAAKCIDGDKRPVAALTPTLPILAPLKATGYVLTADNVDKFQPQW